MKSIKKFIVLCIIIITSSVSLFSQSIGLNYGVAGVENIGAQHSFNMSINFPISGDYFTKLSMMSWAGEDNNRRFQDNYSEGHYFYGNKGINFSIYKSILDGLKNSLYAGIGIGFYQKVRLNNDFGDDFLYEPGISFHLLYRRELTTRFNLVSEGNLHFDDVNFEFDGLIPGGIDWGFLTVGLEYELFR